MHVFLANRAKLCNFGFEITLDDSNKNKKQRTIYWVNKEMICRDAVNVTFFCQISVKQFRLSVCLISFLTGVTLYGVFETFNKIQFKIKFNEVSHLNVPIIDFHLYWEKKVKRLNQLQFECGLYLYG